MKKQTTDKIWQTNERQIVVCDGDKKNIMDRRNIVKISAEHIYSIVESKVKDCKNDKAVIHNEMVRVSLNKWEDILNDSGFFRIGRSTIVNFKFVIDITDKILLDTSEILNIPVRNRTRVKRAYREYCKEKGIGMAT